MHRFIALVLVSCGLACFPAACSPTAAPTTNNPVASTATGPSNVGGVTPILPSSASLKPPAWLTGSWSNLNGTTTTSFTFTATDMVANIVSPTDRINMDVDRDFFAYNVDELIGTDSYQVTLMQSSKYLFLQSSSSNAIIFELSSPTRTPYPASFTKQASGS